MTTTTMKTERARPLPIRGGGMASLRLYLVAFLAAAYVLAWWLFGARTPARVDAEPSSATSVETRAEPQLTTWLHDLPPAARPHVDVPAGWHIAEHTAPGPVTRQATPVPVRVSPARPRRIRTRSS